MAGEWRDLEGSEEMRTWTWNHVERDSETPGRVSLFSSSGFLALVVPCHVWLSWSVAVGLGGIPLFPL